MESQLGASKQQSQALRERHLTVVSSPSEADYREVQYAALMILVG
ncbi:hypothetical protein [Cupriavidus oxalaticus]|nr:hypothetical protein [Cupriavidus oxalaticus]